MFCTENNTPCVLRSHPDDGLATNLTQVKYSPVTYTVGSREIKQELKRMLGQMHQEKKEACLYTDGAYLEGYHTKNRKRPAWFAEFETWELFEAIVTKRTLKIEEHELLRVPKIIEKEKDKIIEHFS